MFATFVQILLMNKSSTALCGVDCQMKYQHQVHLGWREMEKYMSHHLNLMNWFSILATYQFPPIFQFQASNYILFTLFNIVSQGKNQKSIKKNNIIVLVFEILPHLVAEIKERFLLQ